MENRNEKTFWIHDHSAPHASARTMNKILFIPPIQYIRSYHVLLSPRDSSPGTKLNYSLVKTNITERKQDIRLRNLIH